jgi:N-acetylglucosamine kinase-like BadF-type ATPase
MGRFFLGVDVGATKSQALIADEAGKVVGWGEGGPGNYEVVGYAGLAARLQEITQQTLNAAGISIAQIAAAGLGVAGYDWPAEREPTLKAIQTLGLQAPLELVNDTVIGLLAGASEGWGVAVVAGTSNNCWGWDRQRRIGRVTGNGPLMGEYGGASELVKKAVHAVAAEWTRRGPSTALTQRFVRLTGAVDSADLLQGLALGRYHVGADAAPLVFEAAQKGDQVAGEVIRWTGRELGSLANGVIRQLGFEKLAFEVVLVGSLYDGGPSLIEPMRETIHALAPQSRLVRLAVPPVLGAVLLGMEQAGLKAQAHRPALIRSIEKL